MKVTSTKCIAECRKCITKCQKCCQMNKNKADMKECCKCCKCCIIICKAVCEMLKCDDTCDMTKRLCMLCVSCCKKCATQCAKFKNTKACKDCSIACKRCETACKKCGNSKTKSITKRGGGTGNGSVATIVNNPNMSYVNQLRSTVILVELYDVHYDTDTFVTDSKNNDHMMIMGPHNQLAKIPKSNFIIGSHESFSNIFQQIGEVINRDQSQFYCKTSNTDLGHKTFERIDRYFVSLKELTKKLDANTPGNGPRNGSSRSIFQNISQLVGHGIIEGPSTFYSAISGKEIYQYIGVNKAQLTSNESVYTLKVYIDLGLLKAKLQYQAKDNETKRTHERLYKTSGNNN